MLERQAVEWTLVQRAGAVRRLHELRNLVLFL